jgi:hypothetical protein
VDSDLTEKIRKFLSDPGAADKIAAVAGTLSSPKAGSAAPESPAAASEAIPVSKPAPKPAADRQTALLEAIRPLLRTDKQGKVDNIRRAMTVASLFGTIRKK